MNVCDSRALKIIIQDNAWEEAIQICMMMSGEI